MTILNISRLLPIFDPSVKDWAWEARILRWLTFLWLFTGLVVMFSASYPSGFVEHGDGLYYVKRQIIWILIGLLGFNIVVHSPLRYIMGIANFFVLLLLGCIWMTQLPGLGQTAFGATRWLKLGPVLIQPSELIKPFLILQSARIFGHWNRFSWGVRITWLGIFAIVLLGILKQPNLSTTALCGMTLWLVALASGIRFSQLGGTALAGLMLGILSVTFQEYQRRRVLSFLNPWADAMGDGYQLTQSLMAVGSGGTVGNGFGMSQQKLFFLPIQYSDFIFSVFAEEFGLLGCLGLFLLLVAYGTMALRVAFKAHNILHQLVAIGAMVLMIGQSLLNIGVATGALPTTGLPLPLVSYGGSSMIASLLTAGLLIRVARESSGAEVLSLEERRARRRRVG